MNEEHAWLLLVSSVSGDNKTARMRIWRALKASGAGTMRDGVYLLPNGELARDRFREQAEVVVAAGGSAHILSFESADAAQHAALRALFDRDAEYANIFARLNVLRRGLAKLEETEARRQLSALRREIVALNVVDFFPGAARRQVEGALVDAEIALSARHSPGEPSATKGTIPTREASRYRARTWATRERPWIDRLASAWLVRRFIDTKAKFLWLTKVRDCPKSAVGFDFDGAEFSHVGARVTFEVLAAAFGLENDRAIVRLGTLVHYLDVGGVAVPEAAGLAAIMNGARARQPDDDKLLTSACAVLDALYAAYRETPEDAT